MSNDNEVPKSTRFDYLIIGGGLVGLYLCNLLLNRFSDIKICLVERGNLSFKFAEGTLKTKNVSHSATSTGRVFGFGGTSRIWGGQLSEFDSNDFEKWPINYKEMKKWYDEVYSLLNCNPPEAIGTLKQDLVLSPNISISYTSWLKKPDFSSYFSGLLSNPKVKILLNKTVNKLLFDDSGKCIGCELHDSSDKYELFGVHTIITAGVFESIKLVSAIDSPQFPQSARSELGHFFQDHIGGILSTVKIKDRNKFQQIFENRFFNGTKIQPKIKSRYTIGLENQISISGFFSNVSFVDEYIGDFKALCKRFSFTNIKKKRFTKEQIVRILREHEAGETIGDICRRHRIGPPTFYQWKEEFGGRKVSDVPKISVFRAIFASLEIISTLCRMVFKLILKRRIHSFFGSVRFHIQCEQIPIQLSKVTVDDDQVFLDWKIIGKEIIAISKFRDDVDEFLVENELGSLELKKRLTNLNDLDYYDTAHASGGLRMTDTDASGVVNPDLSLKGLKNLSCLSSAVFPTSSHANVTLSILALCHKFVAQQQYVRDAHEEIYK